MKELLADLERWQSLKGDEVALATLVCVRGSSPHPPGSRLAMTRGGNMSGSVSGGCVENDVFERALRVLESGRPAVATYGISDEMGFRVGLTCGGSIDVLIEPFQPDDAWQALRGGVERERPTGLAVGLAPEALLGRKIVLLDSDGVVGSIDPDVDASVVGALRSLLLDGGTRLLGLQWRGEAATIYAEGIPPPPRLVIVGATHTAISLSRIAKGMGFHVTVIDARSLFGTPERFPDVDELLREHPAEALPRLPGGAYTHVVVLTHDLKFDIPALVWALRSGARYVGAMGSRRTHERRRRGLLEAGLTDADLARIHAPIGLDLGSRAPGEIALAIMAEIVAVRNAKDGRSLREKRGAVHGDG